MAKTLIGNVKGKDGRGIASIEKTGTTGSVDTYTITYTDGTSSTYTVNNSDSISLQRQIVPSAAVESSTTASQSYTAGDYVVVNGGLRKVKSAIAEGNTIGDSNSTATTVTGELGSLRDSVSRHIVGQKRITFGSKSMWEVIWTKDEFESLTGRTFDPAKVGIALRNDSPAIGGGTVSASLLGTSILAQYAVELQQGTTMTVGYTIVFND